MGDNYKTQKSSNQFYNIGRPNKNSGQSTITKIVDKFKTYGSTDNNLGGINVENWLPWMRGWREVRSNVSCHYHQNYHWPKRASFLPNNVTKDTIVKIIKRIKYYKQFFFHILKEFGLDKGFEFCFNIQGELEEDPFLTKRIILIDETIFSSKTVSSQNGRW